MSKNNTFTTPATWLQWVVDNYHGGNKAACARKSGIPEKLVRNIINGRNTTFGTLAKIAAGAGIKPPVLLQK